MNILVVVLWWELHFLNEGKSLMQITIEGAIVSSADINPNAFGDAFEIYMDTGTCDLEY